MPRARRVLVPGGIYHVYNRVARGEHVFRDEGEARRFVQRIVDVKRRDDLVIMAYCIMSNHYHMAVRMGRVPLSRSMRSIHQRYTQSFNGRHRVLGPLWQGRYKAKLVETTESLWRVIAYIHLNPVAAGIVDDPSDYRFSGHREVVGQRRKSAVVDLDETLAAFGATRREALANFRTVVHTAVEEDWAGAEPGHLPWWRLGRPRSKYLDPEPMVDESRPRIDAGGATTDRERPAIAVEEFVARGAAALGRTVAELTSSSKAEGAVECRQILTILGVERYGYLVKAVAASLNRSAETASRWISRGTRRRQEDEGYREMLEATDRAIASADRHG